MRIIVAVLFCLTSVHANAYWSLFDTSGCASPEFREQRLAVCDGTDPTRECQNQKSDCTGTATKTFRWLPSGTSSCTPPLNWSRTDHICVPPPCNPPNVTNPITFACETPAEQCADDENPAQCECAINGGNWLNLGGGAGECLNGPDNECTSESADYQGTINNQPVCSGDNKCDVGETYGLVNGVETCIPPDFGPPDCDFDTVAVAEGENGDGGFTCAPPDNQPEPPEPPDTDGDGTPDANDPDSNDADGDGNPDSQGGDHDGDGVANSDDPQYQNQYGGGAAAQASRDNGTKIDQTNTALNDLNQQTQNQNLMLEDMKKSLSGMDDNIAELTDHVTADSTATDGLLDGVQTVDESNQAIATAWQTHPTIASFSQIPTLTVSNSCPVFVVPATQFWSAIPMTIICEVLEDNRAILSVLFMGLWTLAAASVFMRA